LLPPTKIAFAAVFICIFTQTHCVFKTMLDKEYKEYFQIKVLTLFELLP
jgi:hypothetical protein